MVLDRALAQILELALPPGVVGAPSMINSEERDKTTPIHIRINIRINIHARIRINIPAHVRACSIGWTFTLPRKKDLGLARLDDQRWGQPGRHGSAQGRGQEEGQG